MKSLRTKESPGSRRLILLFAATTVLPAAGLGWLGWWMVEQDRALETQRAREQGEQAADLAAASLDRLLGSAVAKLGTSPSLVLSRQGVIARQGISLLYYPAVPATPETPDFSGAESLEFRGDLDEAIRALAEPATSKDPAMRGGALLRRARCFRKLGDTSRALASLRELEMLGDVRVSGLPAGLLSRQGAALIHQELGNQQELRKEAEAIEAGLRTGRWLLTRAQYEFCREQLMTWMGATRDADAEAVAFAEAAHALWIEWTEGQIAGEGRRTIWVSGQPVLSLWKADEERVAGAFIGRQRLQSEWLAGLAPLGEFALTDPEGRAVVGRADAPAAVQAVRTASATRLPWTVHATSRRPLSEGAGRRPMLIAAIALMAVVVLGGGYFSYRAIARELAVARLQADFVAAVSHEFRTPLTTMRQLSEMLAQGRVSSDERRRQFYDVLLRESSRLHRLVEGLLNFGRMEAGETKFRFETLDAGVLVREVVEEFRQQAAKNGYEVELLESDSLPAVRADRESLARVFWNLLENAMKYSPECRTVWVELARVGDRVAVRVRDRGMGIPAEEQKEIFRKFVRGAASKQAAIQGTGVGLAMSRQIVAAHGGEISVESRSGEGSVFTVLLPATEQ